MWQTVTWTQFYTWFLLKTRKNIIKEFNGGKPQIGED